MTFFFFFVFPLYHDFLFTLSSSTTFFVFFFFLSILTVLFIYSYFLGVIFLYIYRNWITGKQFCVHDVRAQYNYKMKFLSDCVLHYPLVYICNRKIRYGTHEYTHFSRPRFIASEIRVFGVYDSIREGCYCMSEKMNTTECALFLFFFCSVIRF